MTRQEERSAAIDICKGIGIILVVYGHCYRGLVSADVISSTGWLDYIDYMIYSFHMPLFFVISGIFFKSSASKDSGAFWLGRLKTIVYPYFLWSLIQGGMRSALSGSGAVNSISDANQLLHILWSPIPPFWFLYTLFLCNVIGMLFLKVRSDIVLLAALAGYLVAIFFAEDVVKGITYGFFYFAVGMVLGQGFLRQHIPSLWTSTAILFSAFILTVSFCYWLRVPRGLPFPAAALGVAVTYTFSRAVEERIGGILDNTLSLLGTCSMSIYVQHILVLGLVRTILLRIAGITDPILIMVPAVILAVAVPMAIQIVAVRLSINNLIGLPYSAMGRGKDTRSPTDEGGDVGATRARQTPPGQ